MATLGAVATLVVLVIAAGSVSASTPACFNATGFFNRTVPPQGSSVIVEVWNGSTSDARPVEPELLGYDCNGVAVGTSPGEWFFFNGTGREVTVDLCETNFEARVFAFRFHPLDSGSNGAERCGEFDCEDADENDGGRSCPYRPAGALLTLADTRPDQTYAILVTGRSDAEVGEYTLRLTRRFPFCGDGKEDDGEECDDGNPYDGDGCSAECREERCGDGVVNNNGAEACDDGNLDNSDNCTEVCRPAVCGDGWVNGDPSEACDPGLDDGETVAVTADCNADCTWSVCGDNITNPLAGEQCDDGNTVSLDGCDANCTLEYCGDGRVGAGEECDDGNIVQTDACVACRLATCGDGFIWQGVEECDDGDQVGGDGCSATCFEEYCGDGVVNGVPVEECDDGNGDNYDACTNACRNPRCGDGILQQDEACDEGGNTPDCNYDCTPAVCGDGLVNLAAGELCDDGNGDSGDGCDADCQPELCGDGYVSANEQCDDGNEDDTDACVSCQRAVCGDGVVRVGVEECDDGNTLSFDGCSSTCAVQAEPFNCSVAHSIDVPYGRVILAGQTRSATPTPPFSPPWYLPSFCETTVSSGVPTHWFTFVGTGSNVTINSCPSAFDTKLFVFAGESCGGLPLSCVAGDDDTCGLQSRVNIMAEAGQRYYVVLTGVGVSNYGAYVLSLAFGVPATPVCGDGYVSYAAGEECEVGAGSFDNATCTASCQVGSCGDGEVNAGFSNPTVTFATTTLTYDEAVDHCHQAGASLCPASAVCGDDGTPVFGILAGAEWVPVAGNTNTWLSIGAEPAGALCQTWRSTVNGTLAGGGGPTWGLLPNSNEFQGWVPCCTVEVEACDPSVDGDAACTPACTQRAVGPSDPPGPTVPPIPDATTRSQNMALDDADLNDAATAEVKLRAVVLTAAFFVTLVLVVCCCFVCHHLSALRAKRRAAAAENATPPRATRRRLIEEREARRRQRTRGTRARRNPKAITLNVKRSGSGESGGSGGGGGGGGGGNAYRSNPFLAVTDSLVYDSDAEDGVEMVSPGATLNTVDYFEAV